VHLALLSFPTRRSSDLIYRMFRRVKNKFLRCILLLMYGVLLITCAVQLNFLGLFGYSPTKRDIVLPTLNVASEVYTADSVLIGRSEEHTSELQSRENLV